MGIADDEQRMLMSRFATRFTLVDECSKNTPKTAISATFRDLRRSLQAGRLARQSIAASRDRTQLVVGLAIPKPSAYGCTESAISISADCSLSRAAHHGTRDGLARIQRLKSHVLASISL